MGAHCRRAPAAQERRALAHSALCSGSQTSALLGAMGVCANASSPVTVVKLRRHCAPVPAGPDQVHPTCHPQPHLPPSAPPATLSPTCHPQPHLPPSAPPATLSPTCHPQPRHGPQHALAQQLHHLQLQHLVTQVGLGAGDRREGVSGKCAACVGV